MGVMADRVSRMRTIRGTFRGARPAAALLEVILALSLFVAAAAVIMSSLSTSLAVAKDVRLAGIADDLTISLLSQMQLGMISMDDSGPQPCEEPLEEWTWQVVNTQPPAGATTVVGAPALPIRRIELVLRHPESGYVARTTQWFVDAAAVTNSATDASDTGDAGP